MPGPLDKTWGKNDPILYGEAIHSGVSSFTRTRAIAISTDGTYTIQFAHNQYPTTLFLKEGSYSFSIVNFSELHYPADVTTGITITGLW